MAVRISLESFLGTGADFGFRGPEGAKVLLGRRALIIVSDYQRI